MSILPHNGLSLAEQRLIRAVGQLVPPADRPDWTRTWDAELWHLHHPQTASCSRRKPSNLILGLLCDALWLRLDGCRRTLQDSATLCLLQLLAACFGAMLAGRLIGNGINPFYAKAMLFLVEAPLVVLVTFATTSRRHIHNGTASGLVSGMRRQGFFLCKCALVLAFSYLASVDLTHLPHIFFPLAADILQTLLCVVFAIAGLRWAILDQQQRCKHCLLALASPSHVGRPSHNLLEWNGTQQICRKGHGALSSPELETSWCSHSQWIDHARDHKVLA